MDLNQRYSSSLIISVAMGVGPMRSAREYTELGLRVVDGSRGMLVMTETEHMALTSATFSKIVTD